MALPFSTPSDLDEMLARVQRFQMALQQYRKRGATEQSNTMRLVLALEYSLIRRHCATHDLELPDGIPATGMGTEADDPLGAEPIWERADRAAPVVRAADR